MYEEKSRKSININWKSLIVKMVLLLAALFILIWIVSLFNKKDNKTNESNIKENLQAMKVAADEYFVGSRLPEKVNAKKKITLGEMFDAKLLIEFKDQDNNDCDTTLSYAEATKIDNDLYNIKVKLVCGAKSDYIINTKEVESNNIIDNDDNNNSNDNNDNNINNGNDSDNQNNNGNSNTNTNTVAKPNNTNNNKKPIVSVNTNTTKPNTSKPNTPNTSKPSTTTKPSSNTCKYGNKEYYSYYPLAYIVAGNCAVNPNDIPANDSNKVTNIAIRESKKLALEISNLAKSTNTRLFVAEPKYNKIYNKSGTGVVGYTIEFVARQYIGTYTSKVIYEYHLDQNGNRKVLIDNRSGVTKNQGTTSGNNNTNINKVVRVDSVSLNTSNLNLYVGDTYSLRATINPTNATNKTINWSSNDNSVATVNSNGVVTAKRKGSALITASADGKSTSVRVYVLENIKNYFELTRNSITLDQNEDYRLDFDSNLTNDARDISWSTSNSSVATVNSNGVITARKKGTATITGRINGITSKIVVTVLEEGYINIISDESATMFVGEKHYIKVDSNIDNLKYQSSDTRIATVTYNGIVTAKKPGWVTITISGNGISKTVRLYCAETVFIYDSWVD